MNYDMTTAMNELLNKIKQDYYLFSTRNGREELNSVRAEMCDEFNEKLRFEVGRKYIKVISGGGVWGFVMLQDDKKFKAGDILKAAGWSTPARNKPRGNILEQNFSWVRWTGPEYLFK